jgi:ferredoxin-thioredoxin reductase catalytic chain
MYSFSFFTAKYSTNMTPMKIFKLFTLLQTIYIAQAFAPNHAHFGSQSLLLNTGTPSTSASASVHVPIITKSTHLHLKDEDMTEEEREAAIEKATKAMTQFSNRYIQNTDTKYCSDLSIPAVVIKGLAEHKVTLGAPLCPCRYYEDKEKEAKDGFWNCPCVPMRERHECHCMLFLTEDNAFAGDQTEISFEEVVDKCDMK